MKYSDRAPQSSSAKMAKKSAVLVAPLQGRQTGAVGLLTQYDSEAIEPKVGCIASAMQIIGNKWTALILRDLGSGPKRFSELQKSITGIGPRTLSQRLDELERCVILTKQSFAEVPPRTEYTLTAKGQDLIPVLRQMAQWGDRYAATS